LPDPEELMSKIWNQGQTSAYAHASYLPALGGLLLSNSPECLFEVKDNVIRTMPIKGTIRNTEKNAWERLRRSAKDQAELFMITDLLRNDLNLLKGDSARVVSKRNRLNVSGLIHQYSLIEKRLDLNVSLKQILGQMFPGGSITGAPKKRTMEIIRGLENRVRGHYTGSTIFLYNKNCTSSLNIRSAYIDYSEQTLSYSAGGGITLLSNPNQEYDEMLSKWESFKNLLLY
jgi:anthranilate/para-aminobenzoate synthase component I